MLGRFCTVSADGNQTAFSHKDSEDTKEGLSDYACQECGSRQYHLVFRVEALSDRVTLSVVCDVCSVRKQLLRDTPRPEEKAVEVVTHSNFLPPYNR
ncbi:MAG: hypothetical protein CV089_00150 [Nitrospira sp. WS110]|nr:hypothetical protein [Nitrospira sp. WS110]